MEKPKLIRYLKDKYDRRCGVVVALDRDKIGWSLCRLPNPEMMKIDKELGYDPYEDHDRWNKERGLQIAIGRAEKGIDWVEEIYWTWGVREELKVNNLLVPALKEMTERAKRYYK